MEMRNRCESSPCKCVKLCEKCLPLRRIFVLALTMAVICLRVMLIISIVAAHIIPAAGVCGRTAFVAVVAAAADAGIS